MKIAIRVVLILATVGGGFAGFLAVLSAFWGRDLRDSRLLGILCFGLLVYSIITIAGLMFAITGRAGRNLTLAFAGMVPWVDLPGIEYHLTCALYAAVTVGPPHDAKQIATYEFSAQMGSQFQFRMGGPPHGEWSLGINLFAVLLMILLTVYNRQTREEAGACVRR